MPGIYTFRARTATPDDHMSQLGANPGDRDRTIEAVASCARARTPVTQTALAWNRETSHWPT
ncbi:MAG: hypothetical protein OXI66_02455, partial [Boseongicola sp.]|nr:hypothetical protein [Boseongicola sp.]